MRLAWGLTLNLSSEESQRKLGETFVDYFKTLMAGLTDATDKKYVTNLIAILMPFLRNMGYEKDFLVVELDIQEDLREEQIKNINELADMTSLSTDGLAMRIAAFIFGGSTLSILGLWQQYFGNNLQDIPQTTTTNFKETVNKVGETTTGYSGNFRSRYFYRTY